MTENGRNSGRQNGNGVRRRFPRWHRRIGLVAALLVMVLAISGAVLTHDEDLGLDRRHVRAVWLLDWYGIAPSSAPTNFRAGTDWVTGLEGRVYVNGRPAAEQFGEIVGAVRSNGILAIAATEELLLLTPKGEVLEHLLESSLPGLIQALGKGEGDSLVLRTAAGPFRSNPEFSAWQPSAGNAVWAQAASPPEEISKQVLQAYRGEGLTWERVMLDLHSGRILGAIGPYLMDAAALFLVLLSATGVWNWLRNRR
jgi:hypothetical protein